MASTTQILFNSPALHSLKRDQLVKLCKIHALKASGKNVDLIEKLKRHAETLPKDDPLSVAVRGESEEIHDADDDQTRSSSPTPVDASNLLPRRSEQWEMVMDSIAEEDENSQGTLGSMKTVRSGTKGTTSEFGTGSSKTSTMTSSIKALATSLGLKRGGTSKSTVSSVKSSVSTNTTTANKPDELEDELQRNSTPYYALPPSDPLVEEQPLAFNPSRASMTGYLSDGETPLPGHALRPGVPAPMNGRLSMGLGIAVPTTPSQPTTTIRLVANRTPPPSNLFPVAGGTPQLKPFKTTFDLIMGSPAPAGGIYPTLTFSDLPPDIPTPSRPATHRMEGIIHTPISNSNLGQTPEPFIFGSPLPQHRVSDSQFRTAAASVLEEMNKRLQDQGVEGVDSSVISRLHPGAGNVSNLEPRDVKPLPRARGEFQEQFNQKHQQEFQKMEGIDGFMKRRVAGISSSKVESSGPVLVGKKRKSSVVALNDGTGPRPIGARRASGTRVVSNGKYARAHIPGAFGLDDDDDEQEVHQADERAGKRLRISGASESKEDPSSKDIGPSKEDKIAQDRERQAIKRKLEMNKARRRSSTVPRGVHGRRSGRLSGRVSGGIVQQKVKPSRFGFLSSAKSLVQSVWNRGKPTTTAATSNAAPKPLLKSGATSEKKLPANLLKKPATTLAKPSATLATATSSRTASVKTGTKAAESHLTRATAASSARSRSPIPSFGTVQSSGSSLSQNGVRTQINRNSFVTGSLARKNSVAGATTSTNVSSIGTRLSSTRNSAMGTIGSMGSKESSLAPATRPSNAGSSSSRLSTSSRLLAPTASSLAKSNQKSLTAGLKSVVEHPHPVSSLPIRSPPSMASRPSAALGVITNTPATTVKSPGLFSPNKFSPQTRGKIFSRPLESASGIHTPVNKRIPSPPTANGRGINPPEGVKRSVSGRKPRISRSKVIARLASQRAASGSSTTSAKLGGKARSSTGAKVSRSSFGGAKARSSGGGDVLMSAKKRARQSEYMRRRSRVEALAMSPQNAAMDVDDS